MESLHILIAIFCICLTISFCFGLWVWCFSRSLNHTITCLIQYYAAFNTRLKNAETSINNLNNLLSSLNAPVTNP